MSSADIALRSAFAELVDCSALSPVSAPADCVASSTKVSDSIEGCGRDSGTIFFGRDVVANPRAIGFNCVFFFLAIVERRAESVLFLLCTYYQISKRKEGMVDQSKARFLRSE